MRSAHGVYFGTSSIGIMKTIGEKKLTTVVSRSDEVYKKGKIVPWGANNRFSSDLLKKVKNNAAASAGLGILKASHYGNGLTFYENKSNDKGKREKQVVYLDDAPEIKTFYEQNRISTFYTDTIADLETFGIAYPSFLISNDRKKIVRVKRQIAAWGRREIQNPGVGFSENTYFRSHWEDESTDKAARIPTVDPLWSLDEIQDYCDRKKIFEFVYPTHYTMMDEAYYPKMPWHSVYHNGWLDVSNSIPIYKKHLFENQVNIKYLVYVSEEYFQAQYKDEWETMKPDRRKEIREGTYKAIDEHLSGSTSAGRSMFSAKIKTYDGKFEKGIEVEAVDNKLKDGSYLPDASAANSEILFAQGVDSTLVGSSIPGGSLGAGSGSDKRIAFTILMSLFKTKRETSLSIWDLIHQWNGWDQNINYAFENVVLTTLDKNPTGKQTGV